jgi:cytochrome c1
MFCCLIAGCVGGQTPRSHAVITGGIGARGKIVIVEYRCGSCHVIPGIRGAQGVFGPPLTHMALRSYIGGIFPNNPPNMIGWLIAPSAMKPKTAMPALGLSNQQARDITAYLESLR